MVDSSHFIMFICIVANLFFSMVAAENIVLFADVPSCKTTLREEGYYLHITNCGLTDFQLYTELKKLPILSGVYDLSLRDNNLTHLPYTLVDKFPNLASFSAENCSLTEFPSALLQHSSLLNLYLDGNPSIFNSEEWKVLSEKEYRVLDKLFAFSLSPELVEDGTPEIAEITQSESHCDNVSGSVQLCRSASTTSLLNYGAWFPCFCVVTEKKHEGESKAESSSLSPDLLYLIVVLVLIIGCCCICLAHKLEKEKNTSQVPVAVIVAEDYSHYRTAMNES